ncbi:ferritin-like domain-containing protein [Haematospirillum sp. H1815]|uniref:ferritin-like domain-containing protein n=1 Tax=Haematospirillum sp. H1815 TaxID=2723108 RepID=UPI00143C9A5D|nr:ferritin-like domain-containing protein [Haematospirillum sp. H1815]NKD78053.1 ferritin-like domain-containing protein [Haematospirillum sp. H1815]
MKTWTLDDIPWSQFAPSKVDPEVTKLVKAAALVERNAADYTTYLKNVFHADPSFQSLADEWQEEEVQHGDALGLWAERADPTFDYKSAFQRFRDGYRINLETGESIRGSLTGELIARCIVETGTSSYYSALRDGTEEPVLQYICNRIAGDEFRHYKLFYTALQDYLDKEQIPTWRRLLVAMGRIRESEDDELSFAWHAANAPADTPYDRAQASLAYGARAFSFYRPLHVERASNMVLKAAGIRPGGLVGAAVGKIMWSFISRRAKKLDAELKRQVA